MGQKPPLSLMGLSIEYGPVKAVKNVSFSIEKGEIFGLLGPNGAGKTSIISSITSLVRPTQGHIEIFGQDPFKHFKKVKFDLGYVPQEIISHGFFSIEEILRFYALFYGIKKSRGRIEELLRKLDLWIHRKKKVLELSGGMKRRLLIAKALIHRPKLLLLDEPTAGVDIELRQQLWEFIRELKEQGCAILLTTHYLEEAEALCDRIAILNKGEIQRVDTVPKLLDHLAGREIRMTLSAPHFKKIESPYLKSQNETTLLFFVPKSYEMRSLFKEHELDMENIQDIRIREGNLADVFKLITKGGAHV